MFDSNKYCSNSPKGCVLKVTLEYLTELRESYHYPLALIKQKSKRKLCLILN